MFKWADGTVKTWQQLLTEHLASLKTSGADSIHGTSYNETLDGGAGNDLLQGDNGDDTYIFGRGYGQDTISDYETDFFLTDKGDRILFNADTVAADVDVLRTSGEGIALSIRGTSDVITISNAYNYTVFGPKPYEVEYVEFSDGTKWLANDLRAKAMESQITAGDDIVRGFYSSDIVTGGAENDILNGGDGSDIYRLNAGDGNDTITETTQQTSYSSNDTIELGVGFTTSNIVLSKTAGDDLLISFTGFTDTLTVTDQFKATDIFKTKSWTSIQSIKFADGTVWNETDIRERLLQQQKTAGDDVIEGFFHNDVLDGGAGNDILRGGYGNDTYLFGIGYGQDEIEESSYSTINRTDKVQFGAGVTQADVVFSKLTNDLAVSISGTSDVLTIKNHFSSSASDTRVESFVFADGSSLTYQDVNNLLAIPLGDGVTIQGTVLDDTISGTSADDVIAGRSGDDTINSSSGNDRFVYASGDGNDLINETATSTSEVDVLEFSDINSTDILLSRDGNNLIVNIVATGEGITFKDQFLSASSNYGIEQIKFADGEIWDRPKMLADAMIRGTSASETLTGTNASTGYDSGSGNDAMVDVSATAGGSDWYYWGAGDGNDSITDIGSATEFDKVYLKDLSQGDVEVTRVGDDLRITITETGEYLTLSDQFSEEGDDAPISGIESVIFADGSELLRSDLALVAPIAGTLGSNGNDGMQGLPGTSETLSGGRGSDTYRFARGDGQDTVHDAVSWLYYPKSQNDTVAFGAGIGLSDLLVSRNGENIVIGIADTTDQLTLYGQLRMDSFGVENRIEFFTFAGGGVLTAAEMDQMMINSQVTAGNDVILGYKGNETYYGGAGNNTLKGYGGSDTYLFGRGFGSDLVSDDGYYDTDAIVFGPDIGTSDIVLSRSGNNLLLGIKDTTDVLTIYNTFSGTPGVEQAQSIEEFKFTDGTVWTYEFVKLALLAQSSTSSNDTIIGYESQDVLDGGAGNDTLIGADGGDTYIFGRGYGTDTISGEVVSSQTDVVQFNDTVIPSDVILIHTGYALIIKIAGTNDQLTLVDQFFLPNFEVEEFRFVDGTVWSQIDVQNLILSSLSTSGNDTVIGFDTGDVIDALGGNDIMQGGDGNDDYLWGRGSGVDSITESLGSNDEVILKTEILPTDIQLSRSGNDVILSISGTADQLKFTLYEFGQEGIEQVRFSNGTIWTDANLRAMLLVQASTSGNDTITGFNTADALAGGQGNDTLNGADGGDTLTGGSGNDTLEGGNGNDTIVYSRGDGNDVFTDYGLGDTADKLVFTNINPANVTLTLSGDDITLVISESAPGGGDAGSILLPGALDQYYNSGIEQVVFANGTIWTRADLRAMLISGAGTSGDDTINGSNAADILSGGLGNDALNGGGGNDKYLYSRGDGHDTITDTSISDTADKLIFSDINPSDVTLVRNGSYVTLVIGESAPGAGDSGSIYLTSPLDEYYNRNIEQVIFADGTIWTRLDLRSIILAQEVTAGNETISGFNAADTISGGTGDDTLIGGGGNDTYTYSRGDGHDTINETDLADAADKLVFSNINASDVKLVRNGYNITLVIGESVPGAGDAGSVLLTNNLHEDYERYIEQVVFANGTIWTRNDMRVMVLAQTSTSGNDVIAGFNVADVFTGGQGNDALTGGGGNDTYNYSRGDGNDTIYDSSISDTADKLVFSDINPSDVTLVRNGDDVTLVIGESAPGAGDAGSILLYGNFNEYYNQGLEQVKFANGTIWTRNDLRVQWLAQSATSGDDVINGFDGVDTISGGAGNDTLDGWGGADTLIGGIGDDTYIISTADTLVENAGEGTDTVKIAASYTLLANFENLTLTGSSGYGGTGNALNNVIIGNGGGNTLTGGDGNDRLDGGSGNDTMIGGLGDDTFVVQAAGDVVTEAASAGTDTIESSVTIASLAANVENLILTGTGAINGTGNAADNIITGNSGNNVLDGGAGTDTLIGGAGNDTFVIDNTSDQTIENTGEGTDLVQSSATFTLATNIENLTLAGSTAIDGTGNDLDNVLTGNTGVNTLTGGAGNDTLNGGLGADTLIGGLGDDAFIVDDAGDVVTEAASEGTDTVQSSIAFTLVANVENLTLTGTSAINGTGNALNNILTGNSGVNTLTGGEGNDTLNGAAGADTLIGGLGDDIYVVDNAGDVTTEATGEGADLIQSSITRILAENIENLTLTGTGNINGTGNTASNTIIGTSGNNVLDGGTGADSLSGGGGNDTYVIDNASDQVVENAGEGTDLVQSSIAYTLGANVENLTLTGSAAINGVGNTLDNVLTGNTGINTLTGGDGNDTLNGGTAADTLIGGIGNDTYVVDNAGDAATENADEGTDLVQSSIAWTLGLNLENLTLIGSSNIAATGNALDNVITGNSGNNVLDGGGGTDALAGGSGNDTYIVDSTGDAITENLNQGTDLVQSSITLTLAANVENLTLTGSGAINGVGNSLDNALAGNSGINTLEGGDGNDSLNGGVGADTLIGGAGNDTYVVDDVGDTLTEATLEGTDLVQSSITYTLAVNLENLILTGSAGINGTGNALDNVLTGNTGINTLTGGDGNDTLNGGTGADSLIGGTGNDTYVVDNVGDATTENADEGTDLVQSTVAWTLGANFENLTFTGSAGLAGTGNGLDNVLTGNSGANTLTGLDGNDRLDGGTGNDTMVGGLGNDTYVVQAAGDVVTESAGQGTDTIESSITIAALAANVENLTLTGNSALNGTGNALDNLLTGNSGINTLSGGDGADTLIGASGNDMLTGGLGNDTFYFAAGFGQDTVTDFSAGSGIADIISLSLGSAFDSYAEIIAATSQVGADSVITIDGSNKITLTGILATTLVADDFAFV